MWNQLYELFENGGQRRSAKPRPSGWDTEIFRSPVNAPQSEFFKQACVGTLWRSQTFSADYFPWFITASVRLKTIHPKQTTAAASSYWWTDVFVWLHGCVLMFLKCLWKKGFMKWLNSRNISAEAAGYLSFQTFTFHSSSCQTGLCFVSCDDTGADFVMFTGILLFKVMQNKVL